MYPSRMIPFILLLCTTPSLSTLTVNAPTSPQSATTTTITWTSNASDPVFSIELTHPSFNMAFALANNVDPTLNQLTIELPLVPAGDGYTLEFVNITNINQIFAMSSDFSIAAVSSSQSSLTATISIVPSAPSAASTAMGGGLGGTPSSAVSSASFSRSTSPVIQPYKFKSTSANSIYSLSRPSPPLISTAGTNAQTSAAPTPTLSQSAATRHTPLGASIIFGLVGVGRWIL
ncbi:hypothetical protein R3P38DRAFT_3027723 [Favolaschia claudopus]|uniref:Uncharacterized protein n=1 Tax=Favolaschia claudopus TaxID=2862362 RepID=A0AAW0AGE3_9AGAR